MIKSSPLNEENDRPTVKIIQGWQCLTCLRIWERPGKCADPEHGYLKPIVPTLPPE